MWFIARLILANSNWKPPWTLPFPLLLWDISMVVVPLPLDADSGATSIVSIWFRLSDLVLSKLLSNTSAVTVQVADIGTVFFKFCDTVFWKNKNYMINMFVTSKKRNHEFTNSPIHECFRMSFEDFKMKKQDCKCLKTRNDTPIIRVFIRLAFLQHFKLVNWWFLFLMSRTD